METWSDRAPSFVGVQVRWKDLPHSYVHMGWSDTETGKSFGQSYRVDANGACDTIAPRIVNPLAEFSLQQILTDVEELHEITTHISPELYGRIDRKVYNSVVDASLGSDGSSDLGGVLHSLVL